MLFAALLSFPLLALPHEATVPAEAGGSDLVCGEVLAVDLVNQTFLVREGISDSDTVPFSRWTDFVRRSADAKGHGHLQTLDPTDVRIGDRLCIVLDPSGATADRVEVLPGGHATEIARACVK